MAKVGQTLDRDREEDRGRPGGRAAVPRAVRAMGRGTRTRPLGRDPAVTTNPLLGSPSSLSPRSEPSLYEAHTSPALCSGPKIPNTIRILQRLAQSLSLSRLNSLSVVEVSATPPRSHAASTSSLHHGALGAGWKRTHCTPRTAPDEPRHSHRPESVCSGASQP